MEDIYLSVGNSGQQLLPVPYFEKPVPNVEQPMDYGRAPYGLAPSRPTAKPRIDDEIQYCNYLSPAPRDPNTNVPNEGNKYCPGSNPKPYFKDSCYLMNSKAQGVTGIVCNQAGGSDNANFYRGNQFGVDYEYDFNEREANKKLEYTVERPVQTPIQMENPLVIYDNKPNFFPYPEQNIRENKDYITYPRVNNYTESGQPTYVFPYKTPNFPYEKPINGGERDIRNDRNDIVEKFENETRKNTTNFVVLLFFIIFMLYFVSLFKKR